MAPGPVPPTHTPPPSPAVSASQAALQEPAAIRRLWPLAALVLVAVLLWVFRHRLGFDPAAIAHELRGVAPWPVLLALVAIYVGFVLRATRWAVLLGPAHPSSTLQLLPSQLIGFSAVALFGRVADLARPYLVARRLGTPVATQLAVYSLERAFDLGAAAILFSVALALAPSSMPHHEAFARAGLLSLAATLFLVVFAISVRLAGERLARLCSRLLRPLSASAADAAAERLLHFGAGFRTITSLRQFLAALALSLAMWFLIACTYLFSARAFASSPVLSHMRFTGIMLLLATSLGASLLQLPVLGWFTQTAAIAAAYHGFYDVPLAVATACGALTLLTTSLSVIPAGLLAARLQGINLREASRAAPGADGGDA